MFYGDKYITRVYKSTIWINYSEYKKPSKFDCGLIDGIFSPNYIHSVSGDTMIRVASNRRTKYIRIR